MTRADVTFEPVPAAARSGRRRHASTFFAASSTVSLLLIVGLVVSFHYSQASTQEIAQPRHSHVLSTPPIRVDEPPATPGPPTAAPDRMVSRPIPLHATLVIASAAHVTPPVCSVSKAPGQTPDWELQFRLVPEPTFGLVPLSTVHETEELSFRAYACKHGSEYSVLGHLRIAANKPRYDNLRIRTSDPNVDIQIPLRVNWESYITLQQSVVVADTHLDSPVFGGVYQLSSRTNTPIVLEDVQVVPEPRATYRAWATVTYDPDCGAATIYCYALAPVSIGAVVVRYRALCLSPECETLLLTLIRS